MPSSTGAIPLDLVVEQGITWQHAYIWEDNATLADPPVYEIQDTSGCTGVITVNFGVLPLTTIIATMGGANGSVSYDLTAAQAAALAVGGGVYDEILTDRGGKTHRNFEGGFRVIPTVGG
jgi:hypothetical protein